MLKQIYKNTISGWVAIFLGVIVNIIITPLLLNTIGKIEYGIWVLIFNFISYFYLADFGINSAIVRIYSKYKILDDAIALKSIVTISYGVIFILNIFIMLILFSFENSIYRFLEFDINYVDIYSVLFIIAIIELTSQLILRINYGIIQAKHRFDITYNFNAITALLRIVGISLLIIFDKFNIINFALIYSFSKFIVDLYSFKILQQELKGFQIKLQKNIAKELLNVGSSSLITSSAGVIYNSLPILLFGKLFGTENVFLYSIPIAVMLIISRLLNSIHIAIAPRVSELSALRQDKQIAELGSYGGKISFFLMFITLSFFIFFGIEILYIWLGNNTLNYSELINIYNILMLLLIYLSLARLQITNNFIMKYAGLHWLVSIETIVSVGILLIGSYFFYIIYKNSVFNIYLFAFAMVLVGVFKFLFYKLQRKIKTHSITFVQLFIFIVFTTISYILSIYFGNNLGLKIMSYIVTIATFIVYYWFILLQNKERNLFVQQVSKIRL
jgi:O-antigen/teichoic acid export membrane protein